MTSLFSPKPIGSEDLRRFAGGSRLFKQTEIQGSLFFDLFETLGKSSDQYRVFLNAAYTQLDLSAEDSAALERYEASLSIPNSIFKKEGAIAERVVDISVLRFKMRAGTSVTSWREIAGAYGFDIEFSYPGANKVNVNMEGQVGGDIFPLPIPFLLSNSERIAKKVLRIFIAIASAAVTVTASLAGDPISP